jgi:hypothetical protein
MYRVDLYLYWSVSSNGLPNALLDSGELADQVWEAWNKGEISDAVAEWAWWLIFRPPNNLPDVVFYFFLDCAPQCF